MKTIIRHASFVKLGKLLRQSDREPSGRAGNQLANLPGSANPTVLETLLLIHAMLGRRPARFGGSRASCEKMSLKETTWT